MVLCVAILSLFWVVVPSAFATVASGAPAIAAATATRISLRILFLLCRDNLLGSMHRSLRCPATAHGTRRRRRLGTQRCSVLASSPSRSANWLSCQARASAAAFAQVGA